MSQGQMEWYTIVLPFVGIPPVVIAAMFVFWVGPVWVSSFDETKSPKSD